MKYISLLIMFCCVTVGYASENNYEHIVNAVNNSPNLTASRKKTFKQIQDVIYAKSTREVTPHQLRQLTVPELNLLLKEIKSRSQAVQIVKQSQETSEIERLCKLQSMIKSEYKKWHEKFVYNENKKDHDHIYVYHPHYY